MNVALPHAQSIRSGSEGEDPSDTITAAEPGLVLAGDRLDPAERFFDALPDALADGIATVPGRSAIDRRTAAAGVLRDMRRHVHRARFIDEVLRIVGLVGAERDRLRPVGAGFD